MIGQLELRRRAREKFSLAERMFFTPKGLEQATDQWIAAHKAARFAGRERVFDLCSGVGGDLAALAGVCMATGVERDEVCAHFAAMNARVAVGDAGRVDVLTQDVRDLDLRDCDAWHIDPDRRPQGRRTTRSELYEPSAEVIESLLAQNPNAAIKLAPAATWPESWTVRAEFEWISRGRQCRQLVAWFGELAQFPGQRRASVFGSTYQSFASIVGGPKGDVPVANGIGRYLFEPDAAVLAAKLEYSVACGFRLAAVAPGIAYWTADELVDGYPLVACFEVDEVLPFDLKKVKAALARARRGASGDQGPRHR